MGIPEHSNHEANNILDSSGDNNVESGKMDRHGSVQKMVV